MSEEICPKCEKPTTRECLEDFEGMCIFCHVKKEEANEMANAHMEEAMKQNE